MKNIHVIATNKPSRVFITKDEGLGFDNQILGNIELDCQNQNIYITSDEEIKEGDYVYSTSQDYNIQKVSKELVKAYQEIEHYKKIILTTDQDLIKDGVQAIDDEFLEWFVNNPSCEEVEIINTFDYIKKGYVSHSGYKIQITKEEPKQIYYNTVGREDGKFVIKGQFNTQKEALDLANELNRKFPELYYDWGETLIKEEPKQETTLEDFCIKFVEKHFEDERTFNKSSVITAMKVSAKWQQERSYSEEEVIQLLIKFNQEIIEVEDVRGWFKQFKKK